MLLDTSGLFCLYSEEDKFNKIARELYANARKRFTTNYVLAEYVALAHVRGISRKDILAFSQEILIDNSVDIIWIDKDLHFRAVDLLAERADKTYSLCDAVSFITMQDRHIDSSLTTDKHFEQEGFVRLLK